jgi:hypothetical protein
MRTAGPPEASVTVTIVDGAVAAASATDAESSAAAANALGHHKLASCAGSRVVSVRWDR